MTKGYVKLLQRALRDWSLITGREGLQNGKGGGHIKVYPYEKGVRLSLSCAEGGAQQVLG